MLCRAGRVTALNGDTNGDVRLIELAKSGGKSSNLLLVFHEDGAYDGGDLTDMIVNS